MISQIDLYDQLLIQHHPNSLVSYKGPITPAVIAMISGQLQQQTNNRLFSIFMELAQNMQYYSSEIIRYAEKKEKVGWFQVLEDESQYELRCGNALEKEKVSQLLEHCRAINRLDREHLRKLKRKTRRIRLDTLEEGAGIGLIQVAILANKPLEVSALECAKRYNIIVIRIKINK